MIPRSASARKLTPKAASGQPQLTLARLMLIVETGMRCFARPLYFAAGFVGLAWLGLFEKLYPYAHLVALVLFLALFYDAVGRALRLWRSPTLSAAKRRVEEANGLAHRPLDVLDDRTATVSPDAQNMWQAHVQKAREQTEHLRWPHFKFDFLRQGKPHYRFAVLALLTLGLLTGWGALGARVIAAINPALGKIPTSSVAIDAWITPPAYTHLSPIMIATPAGDRLQNEVITVPEGSVLHAHLAEKDGDVPSLEINNQSVDFSAEGGKDFDVTETITDGNSVAIHRGWRTLSSWKIQIKADTAPIVAFTDAPAPSERKSLRVAYDAKDDYGVTSVTLRMTPRQSIAGIPSDPVDYPLASTDTKNVKRVDFKDLTAEPWAGLPVDLKLIATDAAGHKVESQSENVTLPERDFFHPIARVLIDERKKLLQNMTDAAIQTETANVMGEIAHQPARYNNDPVVMMALRAGAVRMVLDRNLDAALSAKDILWQSAVRIEDGMTGMAEENLRQAQKELADALDHNASEKDVQAKIDRLHQALSQFLAQLANRMAAQPNATQPVAKDLGKDLNLRTNTLTPQDLERMLNDMKSLSASGAREEARETLSQLQQMLENLSTTPPDLTAEQIDGLQMLKDLKQITEEQQKLMDQTFQESKDADKTVADKNTAELTDKQSKLEARTRALSKKIDMIKGLSDGANAMEKAGKTLKDKNMKDAASHQGDALQALRAAQKSITQQMKLTAMPGGSGNGDDGDDPLGRGDGNYKKGQASNVHVPDQMESKKVRQILNEIQQRAGDMSRSKTERDYIERLLQNF